VTEWTSDELNKNSEFQKINGARKKDFVSRVKEVITTKVYISMGLGMW